MTVATLYLHLLVVVFLLLSLPPVKSKKWLEKLQKKFGGERGPEPCAVDDFLTPDEAERLLQRYEPLLRESLHHSSTGRREGQYRTSRSVRLPPIGDPLVFEIERRAARLAGFNHSQVEDFQLACYGEDQLYGLHRDDDNGVRRANRSATVLIYLREPLSGGATLFTRRKLEQEKDMDTKKPLKTEAGALKLFRHYCSHPRRSFVVVQPKTGRAVEWKNWYGDGLQHFASDSTHGACPVIQGTKCVIQQWITKSQKLPLRDERVVAIFTAGADYSFRRLEHNGRSRQEEKEKPTIETCLSDVSANLGRHVSQFCLHNDTIHEKGGMLVALDDSEGPYSGVGGMRVTGSLKAMVPAAFVDDGGLAISFWARNLQNDTTILSVADALSVRVSYFKYDYRQILELAVPTGDDSSIEACSSRLEFYNYHPETDWFWYSLSVHSGESSLKAELIIYSARGELIGRAFLDKVQVQHTCVDSQGSTSSTIELRMLSSSKAGEEIAEKVEENRTAFVSSSQQKQQPEKGHESVAFVPPSDVDGDDDVVSASGDISLILFHNDILDSREVAALRREVMRYNVHT